jgi:hypothetical protein
MGETIMSTATYAPANPATAFGDPLRSGFGAQFGGAAYGPGFGLDPQMGQYGQQLGQFGQLGQQFGQPGQQFGQHPFQQQHHLQHAIAQHVQHAIAQQVQQAQIQQAIAQQVQQVQQQQIQQAIAQQIQQQQIQQAIARQWQQGHPGAMYGGLTGSPYGQQMWN